MTNQKKGLAGYDNDQQRKAAGTESDAMVEKGSQMERGTSHEFSTEDISDSGAKDQKVIDRAPGGDPEHSNSGRSDSAGQGRTGRKSQQNQQRK